MKASPAGLVVIDKPEGPSSFDVVARVRRAIGTREVGHCGTLDPLATGVLVVAVGSWTRLVRVLTADDKRYTATISFGTSTTTDDREGDVVATGDPSPITEAAIRAALATMTGNVQQLPPAYSAIHVGGERAYEKARRGEIVEMKLRDVVIHGLELLSFERGDASTTMGTLAVVDVRCGKGTYVRSIARDLGAKLGVPAHLRALRRTESGAYTLADAVPLAELDALGPAGLKTGRDAVRGVPFVEVTAEEARALGQGKRIPTEARFEGTGLAHEGEKLVALAHVDDSSGQGLLVVERGFGGGHG